VGTVRRGYGQSCMIYALLDGKTVIDAVHLRAGLALWEYSEESAGLIFGDLRGDPVADEILAALKRAGDEGMTRTQIRILFSGHQSSGSISVALAALFSEGLARMESRMTGGRSREVWRAR
jgi:hypothetical protein